MAVLAIVSCITVRRVAPLVRSLHRGTGGAAVLVLPWTPPPVLVVVELGTSVALPTQPGRLLARLRLVVGEHVGRVQPLGVVVQQASLLVQAVWTKPILITRLVHFPCFPATTNNQYEHAIINHPSKAYLLSYTGGLRSFAPWAKAQWGPFLTQ